MDEIKVMGCDRAFDERDNAIGKAYANAVKAKPKMTVGELAAFMGKFDEIEIDLYRKKTGEEELTLGTPKRYLVTVSDLYDEKTPEEIYRLKFATVTFIRYNEQRGFIVVRAEEEI